MKTIVTFLALFLTFVTYSQEEVRSFYQSEGFYSYTKTRSHLVSERNGILYFFAISEVNVNGNIELVYGPLDNSTLLPLAYFTVELPVQINQFNYLNGLNIVDNRVELIVQSRLFSLNSRFEFFTIDLDSNEILNHTSTPYDFSLGFCRARVNNGKLVLYAEKKSTSEFVRLEKSIDSTYKIEQTGFTFFSIDGIRKLSELEIVNGNEFVVFCNNQVQGTEVELLKRNSIGFYMKTQLPANSYSRKWDFFPIQNNSFLFLSSNAAIKINQDLDILETVSASFCNQEISNFSFCEGFEFNDTIYTIVDNYLEIYDQNLNMLTMHDYGRRIQNMDVLNISGNKWMIGYSLDTDKAGYPDSLQKSIVLIKNGSRKEFTEHHRALKWGKFEMMVGNYNGLFSGKDGYFNLMYESNDNLSKTGPIYASADNLLGKNVNDELVGTWQRYSYQGSKRLPGPLFTSVADSNMQRDKYNRSYYVTAQMIADHVGHILTYNNPHYGIPDGIRYWPGNGNVANGEAQKLADFVDHNNNGIYEPMLGEFPKIYGDRCLLTMYHQDQSESLNNSLEIHRYLYQYDCDTNEILKNTIFCNVRYINRGTDMHDVYVGSFIDFDLGYVGDDFVGTNVDLGLVYVYNGDEYDENNAAMYGFKDSIPAFGQLMLLGAKTAPDGEDNEIGVGEGESINGVGFGDGIIDNEYYTLEASYYTYNMTEFPYTDAVNVEQFYYSLQGLANDGTPQIQGATGPYSLIGDSDPNFYATGGIPHANNYSETAVGNASGDRRMVSGSGPGVLAAGDTLNYLTAYIISFGDLNDSRGPSVGQLFSDARKVKNYFASNDLGCGKSFDLSDATLKIKSIEQLDFSIYPNPFNQTLNIQHEFTGKVDLSVRNLNGQEVYSAINIPSKLIIDLDLSAGVYLMELSTSKGKVVKKLIRK